MFIESKSRFEWKRYLYFSEIFNQTPLHFAAQGGHLSVVEYLVDQKADINARDHHTETVFLILLLFIMLLEKAT